MSLLQDARTNDTTPSFTQSELPRIIYWTKKDYLKDYNNGKGFLRTTRNGDSGTVGFLEDENGNIVNKDEQARMRDFQRSLAYTLLKFGLAPTSRGRCTRPAQEYVVCSMRLKFPVFRYCADNWKADTFMGLYYSQWSDRPQASGDSETNRVKQETTDSASTELSRNGKTRKRPASSSMTNVPSTKRKKLEQDAIIIVDPTPDESNRLLIPTAPTQLQIIRAPPGPRVSQPAAHTVSTTTAADAIPLSTQNGRTHLLAATTPDIPPLTQNGHTHLLATTGTPDIPLSTQNGHTQLLATTTPDIPPSSTQSSRVPSLAAATMAANTLAIPSMTQNGQAHSISATIATTTATEKVLAVALSTENYQARLSVLPNPLMQLAQAVITQQSAGLPLHASTSNSPVTATTTITATDANKPKRKRKEADPNSTMRPSANSTSARNLYATEWCKENKGGTRGQYAAVRDAMKANKDPRVSVSLVLFA